ncbi:MAG: cobyrinate a,c-diamide synthase [Lachnospiraceae bacterium]|nr:cobyrinate a,c-diamide synthase [Lachnospiraceae bacterium]
MKKIMIAAPKSGSGKTSVTIALLKALKENGIKTVSFKCGPDYIDPLFHREVLGITSYNLDTFFTSEESTKEIFEEHSKEAEVSVIEGVMGLYDGLGGIREEGSSYHLAKVTVTPIILVIDAKGMGKSLTALIKGFLDYDSEKLIKGVILNRISKGFFETISPVIEEETGVKVIGFLKERKDLDIPSRHLGLFTPDNLEGTEKIIENLYNEFCENISLEKILEIASENGLNKDFVEKYKDTDKQNCEELNSEEEIRKEKSIDLQNNEEDGTVIKNTGNKCKIAVAKDEAFCFLYEDNLRMLEKYGAEIEFFSPLCDKEIPKDADAILLPGGYPENYLEELCKNETMLKSIKDVFENKMPTVAECGGFMYLHEGIEDKEKRYFKTVGVVDSKCVFTCKSVRFGYIVINEKNASFLPENESIKGHEFHYYDSEKNGDSCTATKPVTGKSYDCILTGDFYWLGFPHLYYPSNPEFAKNFVLKAIAYKNKKEKV